MALRCGTTSSLSTSVDPAGINLCCCIDLSELGRLPQCGLGVGFLACSQHRWDEEMRVSWYKHFSKETSCCDQSLACVCSALGSLPGQSDAEVAGEVWLGASKERVPGKRREGRRRAQAPRRAHPGTSDGHCYPVNSFSAAQRPWGGNGLHVGCVPAQR